MSSLPDHIKKFESGTVYECTHCGKKMFYVKESMESLSAFNRRIRQFRKTHRLCKGKA